MIALMLLFPPVIALGITSILRKNDGLSAFQVFTTYSVFALLINTINFLILYLFFGSAAMVFSDDNITISFALKYLLLGACVSVAAAFAAHYLIKLIKCCKNYYETKLKKRGYNGLISRYFMLF